MEDFLKNLYEAFKGYFTESSLGDFWVAPAVTFLACYLLTTVSLKFYHRKRSPRWKRVFIIHIFWIGAGAFVSMLVIGIICQLWLNNYYADHHFRLSHLLSLLLSLAVPLISFLSLSNHYAKDRLDEIVGPSISINQKEDNYRAAKKTFTKAKLWMLLPPLGFLMLLFAFSRGFGLVAFMIDDSGSMADPNQPISNLSYAKTALANTIDQLDDNTDIVITSLTDDRSAEFPNLDSQTETSEVPGESHLFTNRREAKSYVQRIGQTPVPTSPISAAIWHTFLFVDSHRKDKPYGSFALVVVTDGGDQVSNFERFFCESRRFGELFRGNIHFVNMIHPYVNDFFNAANRCRYPLYPGTSVESYMFAFDRAVASRKADPYFIAWVALIAAAMICACLVIQPKRMR